jgi:hypothetical protein
MYKFGMADAICFAFSGDLRKAPKMPSSPAEEKEISLDVCLIRVLRDMVLDSLPAGCLWTPSLRDANLDSAK